ncbi:MAG: bifunctional diguanylate cyclase/phosphodiesterase [Pseudomonadota bacterium]
MPLDAAVTAGENPDELFRHGRRLNRLLRQATRHDLDDEARFTAIMDEAARSLGLNLLFLAEWDDIAGVRFRHVRLDGDPAALDGAVEEALRGLALASQEPLVLDDLARDPVGDGQVLRRETGMVFYAGVPVWSGDALAGVLGGLARCPPEGEGFAEADLAYLELVAGWLGHHLYQVRQRLLLERHALTDALTGLLNRRAAEGRLHEEMARARRHGESFAVALVDIDHFKRVNDRYGHAVGDQVLKVVSRRLEAGLRDDDWLARWGGEEFLIFLRDADVQEASYVMQRLTGHVKAQPIATQVGNIAITLSAGIGLPERDDADYHPALELADSCLYQAKSNGRDRVEAFDATATHWPVQVVKRALRDARVRVASQVIVDLQTGQPVADESLARVALPDGRLVSAGEFVEVAEGLGLMSEIDRYVTRQAMARCTANLSQGKVGKDFAHFVNLSPQFLARRDLVEEMLANAMSYCQSCNLDLGPVKPIVFEITERQFLSNLETLEADLKPLLDFGFRLALDDFGSGYSSFLYLARLPISYLKIEGWMVANMKQQRKIAAIVESLAGFARRENIITVAECIEDEETARILRDMGVHLGQGWYFGRPVLEENQY